MVPPIGEKPFRLGDCNRTYLPLEAPISQWENAFSFDTAADCAEGKKLHYSTAEAQVEKAIKTLPDNGKGCHGNNESPSQHFVSILLGRQLAAVEAQCIATDDPRLKEPR